MGVIWQAEHLSLGTPIAVKLMHSELERDEDFQEAFFQEARIAAYLRSPHVVQVLDFGIHMHSPFIAMELLEGESLSRRLLRQGPLSLRHCQKLLKQVAGALGLAHSRGVIHCDLKPENVFLLRQPDGRSDPAPLQPKDQQPPPGFAKLVDFGIAQAFSQENESSNVYSDTPAAPLLSSSTDRKAGTPIYMSPEQVCGNANLPGSDIWALGILACECLTGSPPFPLGVTCDWLTRQSTETSRLPSDFGRVPPGFDRWFSRACAVRPERRYSSIVHASQALSLLQP